MSNDAREAKPGEDDRFQVASDEGTPDEGILGDLWDTKPGQKPLDENDLDRNDLEEDELGEDDLEEGPGDEPGEGEERETPGQPAPVVPPQKYKFRGKEYDLKELAEAGLLENVLTQAEQVAHYQELYHAAKTQAEAIQEQARQMQMAQQQAAQRPPITVDQALNAMRSHVEQAVREGYLEPEFVQDYPAAAASQMLIYNDYIQLKRVVSGMYQYFMKENAEKMYRSVQDNFNNACDSLTSKHEVYKPLTSPEERSKFFDFLSTKVNPEAGAINAEFLARQFLAYQQEAILQTMKQGMGDRSKAKNKKRKLAAGEGGSSPRKGLQRSNQITDDEAIMSGMMKYFG